MRSDLGLRDVAFLVSGGLFAVLLLLSLAQSGQVREAQALAGCLAAYVLVELGRAVHRRRQVTALGGAELRPVHLQESRLLPCPAAAVWATVVEPEHAPALDGDVVRAERVPGTPRGVGEQHRSTSRDGDVSVLEVVAWEEGRRVATRGVGGHEQAPLTTYELEPAAGGCVLTVGTAWPALDGRQRLALRRHEGDHRWALRRLLEDVERATATRLAGPEEPRLPRR